jgi:hypothetical protein
VNRSITINGEANGVRRRVEVPGDYSRIYRCVDPGLAA